MNLINRVKEAVREAEKYHNHAQMRVPRTGTNEWIYLDDLLEQVLPELERFERLKALWRKSLVELGRTSRLDTMWFKAETLLTFDEAYEIEALCKESEADDE